MPSKNEEGRDNPAYRWPTSITSKPMESTHKSGKLRTIMAFPHHPRICAITNSSNNVSCIIIHGVIWPWWGNSTTAFVVIMTNGLCITPLNRQVQVTLSRTWEKPWQPLLWWHTKSRRKITYPDISKLVGGILWCIDTTVCSIWPLFQLCPCNQHLEWVAYKAPVFLSVWDKIKPFILRLNQHLQHANLAFFLKHIESQSRHK